MSKPRRIVALTFALSLLTPAIARAQPGTEVPPPEAGDPVATEASVPPPVDVSAPAPTPPIPPKPAFSGKGLLISAYAVTGFSWLSRGIALGLLLSVPARCDTESCDLSSITAGAAFTYIAPLAQATATGLVIPGGVLKGRTDGWGNVTSGAPKRNGRGLLIAGAVVFGVFTAASIALRPAFVIGCINSPNQCGGTGSMVGYYLGVQATDTLSTAGAGMMSYGIAYQNMRKTYGTKIAVAPFSSRGAFGVSVGGRF